MAIFLVSTQIVVRRTFENTHPADGIAGHPIQERTLEARFKWLAKIEGQTKTWSSFVREYERRYGFEVPGGMYRWWHLAKDAGFPLVDEFDSMMASLEPFRAMGGAEVRRRTIEVAGLPTFSLLKVSPKDELLQLPHPEGNTAQITQGKALCYSGASPSGKSGSDKAIRHSLALAAMLDKNLACEPSPRTCA